LTFPIRLCVKPNHVEARAVYALDKVEIQPHQKGRVPIRVKAPLPNDRDFIFESGFPSSKLVVPAQMVDAQFAYVDAMNNTDRVQVVRKRDRLGRIYEADFTSAYQVASEAAALCAPHDEAKVTSRRPPLI